MHTNRKEKKTHTKQHVVRGGAARKKRRRSDTTASNGIYSTIIMISLFMPTTQIMSMDGH